MHLKYKSVKGEVFLFLKRVSVLKFIRICNSSTILKPHALAWGYINMLTADQGFSPLCSYRAKALCKKHLRITLFSAINGGVKASAFTKTSATGATPCVSSRTRRRGSHY
jgi:hypothetical protein